MVVAFWIYLYVVFKKSFGNADRTIYNIVMVLLPVKLIMSMESATLDDCVPQKLWDRIRVMFTDTAQQCSSAPAYRFILQCELTRSASVRLGRLSRLESCKLNKVPVELNSTDVVIHRAVACNKCSWRCQLWVGIVARRFLNEGAFLLAFLQMLNLSKSHKWKYSRSLEEFLQADLPNHFSELLSRILAESPSTEVFFMTLDRVC